MKLYSLLMAVICVLFFLNGDGHGAPQIKYTMGAVSSSSSAFAFCVATGELINKHVPGVAVTVMETGATHDDLVKFRDGIIDFAVDDALDGITMAYNGKMREQYIGKPITSVRVWLSYTRAPNYFCIVNEGKFAKINNLKDLNQQPFSAGIPGSSTEFCTRTILNTMGIKPNWYRGSIADAKEACKDLYVAGFSKTTPKFDILDTTMMDLATMRKIKILSFTEEEIKNALGIVPGIVRIDCPADAIKTLSPHPKLTSFGLLLSSFLSTKISQEIGYKMTRAVADNWGDIIAVYPASKYYDPLKDNLADLSSVPVDKNPPPFHAGLVQYYEERGFKVPSRLIPPEYKKTK